MLGGPNLTTASGKSKGKAVAIYNTEDLLAFHEKVCAEARDIMSRKNKDYGAKKDPFANFRRYGKYGIAVRLDDKMSRLASYYEKGYFAVGDEGLRDLELDVINYMVLHAGMDLCQLDFNKE